jgi:hypothetical protein
MCVSGFEPSNCFALHSVTLQWLTALMPRHVGAAAAVLASSNRCDDLPAFLAPRAQQQLAFCKRLSLRASCQHPFRKSATRLCSGVECRWPGFRAFRRRGELLVAQTLPRPPPPAAVVLTKAPCIQPGHAGSWWAGLILSRCPSQLCQRLRASQCPAAGTELLPKRCRLLSLQQTLKSFTRQVAGCRAGCLPCSHPQTPLPQQCHVQFPELLVCVCLAAALAPSVQRSRECVAGRHFSLPVRLPACLPAMLPARLPTRLPANLLVCLPACLPASGHRCAAGRGAAEAEQCGGGSMAQPAPAGLPGGPRVGGHAPAASAGTCWRPPCPRLLIDRPLQRVGVYTGCRLPAVQGAAAAASEGCMQHAATLAAYVCSRALQTFQHRESMHRTKVSGMAHRFP